MLQNSQTQYGVISVMIHWLMALLIIALFAVGLYMTGLGYYDNLYYLLPWWHKSIGLLVIALLLLRILWKVVNPTPLPLQSHKTWEINVARIAHGIFYLFILLITLSGYLISTANGDGISFFDWFNLPALTELDPAQTDFMGDIHFYLAWALFLLLAVHVAAALKHHFIDKDSTLKHMTLRK